ncbi:MAG: hypothetical protein ACT4P4_09425 [Betaproteobacteria bacterium]
MKSTVEETAALQGIKLNTGRSDKIAAALEPLLKAHDPLRESLDFDVDATTYLKTIQK